MTARSGYSVSPELTLETTSQGAPKLDRTIIVPPDEITNFLNFLYSGQAGTDLFGGMYPTAISVTGVGKSGGTPIVRSTVDNSIFDLPTWGADGSTAGGGYEVKVTLSSDPTEALALSQSSAPAQQQQAARARSRVAKPSVGGVLTMTTAWETQAIPLHILNQDQVDAGLMQEIYYNKRVPVRSYTYLWNDLPISYSPTELDDAAETLNTKKVKLPIRGKYVQPGYLLFAGADEVDTYTMKDGKFERKLQIKIVLKERMRYPWTDFFYADKNGAEQTKSLPQAFDTYNHAALGFFR